MENDIKRRRIENDEEEHLPQFEFFSNDVLDTGIPSIHVLNDDCLDAVFDRLKFAELLEIVTVCKRWYNAVLYKFSRVEEFHPSNESDFLNSVTLNHEAARASGRRFALKILNYTKGNLKTFITGDYQDVGCPIYLEKVLKLTPNLETLDISSMDDYKNGIDKISFAKTMAKYLPKSIRKLEIFLEINWDLVTKDLPNLENISTVLLSSSDILEFLKNLKNNLRNNKIRRLCIELYVHCDITADTFKFILRNYFLTLEELGIHFWTTNIAFVFSLTDSDMEPLTRMKRFSFNCIEVDTTFSYVLQVLKLMPNLEELVLYFGLPALPNEDLNWTVESISNRLAENLPKSIRKLAIRPNDIFEGSWESITASLPNLEILNNPLVNGYGGAKNSY